MKGFLNLLNAKYAIQPSYGLQMAAVAYLILNRERKLDPSAFGLIIDDSEPEPQTEILNFETESGQTAIAVMKIQGPLFRDDQICGPAGMLSMAKEIQRLDQDPKVNAIILDIFSPGGQVQGTEILANAVANISKPLIAWGEYIASGAMYVAAGADHIMLSGKNAEVGSIGVQIGYYDFSKHFEDMGIKYVHITADTSPDKNAHNFDNPTDEDKAQIRADILNPIDDNFMAHVRTHLPGVSDDALTGKMYYAADAIKKGLAHSIGSIDDAIQLALDMAGKKTKESFTFNTMKTESKELINAGTELVSAYEMKIAALEKTIETKDATIKIQAETIGTLQAEVNRLSQLSADDLKSTVIAKNDALNQIEDLRKQQDDPMLKDAQEMIARAKRDAARRKN